jgi:hypothetical protein
MAHSKLTKAINRGCILYSICTYKGGEVKVTPAGLMYRSGKPNKYSWSQLALWDNVDLRSLKV